MIRLDAPLFWANAAEIHDRVIGAVDDAPGMQALVLDMEATSQLDTTAIDALELLHDQLQGTRRRPLSSTGVLPSPAGAAAFRLLAAAGPGAHVAQHRGGSGGRTARS